MASIKINKDKNGVIKSCRFRACLGRDNTGKQVWASKTVSDIPDERTEAKIKKAWQLQADLWEKGLLNGTESRDNSSFAGFVEGDFWTLHVEGGNLRPSTVAFYKAMSPRCIAYFGTKKLNSIQKIDCEKFMVWLRDQKQKKGEPLSARTQKYIHGFLRVVFDFAEENGYITVNPMRGVKPPKQPHHEVQFLGTNDAQAFLSALQDAPLRWRAIMQIMLYLGLRRGELCGLKWENIDFDSNTISIKYNVTYSSLGGVQIGEPKTANSFRTLPAPAVVMSTLKEWKTEQAAYFRDIADTARTTIVITPTAFVFSGKLDPYSPMFPTHLTKRVKAFCKAHNLPDMSPHDLRHTCGSLMLEAGVNLKAVQQFLGHEDGATTLKFYAGVDAESLRKATENLSSALASGN